MKTVVIDNYDSFTYNLVHYIEEINEERPVVLRNDEFELSDLSEFDIIVLSPGPGLPEDANLLMDVIRKYHSSKIILGVCLGHQAIALHFGGKLKNLNRVHHGVSSLIDVVQPDEIHRSNGTLEVGRYHSWVVDTDSLPDQLQITSIDKEGHIMSLKHSKLPVYGIQYHPESILTPKGKELLLNFFSHFRSNSQSLGNSDK